MRQLKFDVGDRVHYMVYVGNKADGPDRSVAGTVVEVVHDGGRGGAISYLVRWDDVDYARYQPSRYKGTDLVRKDA